MRLYHVSEEADIKVFEPRIPTRTELDQNTPLVWAVNEDCLQNFLMPRDCPRVTFYAHQNSKQSEIERYIGNNEISSVIAIEHGWFDRMMNTTLYVYEFNPSGFVLQDEIAGYYVSTKTEIPIRVTKIDHLFDALFERKVELRLVPSLWPIFDAVKDTSLGFSMCRMKNAQPR